MTQQEAKELAVKKWQYIVDNGGSRRGLAIVHPEMDSFMNQCSYCQLYIIESSNSACVGCPLCIKGVSCMYKGHPYLEWAMYSTKENAQKVLDLILET